PRHDPRHGRHASAHPGAARHYAAGDRAQHAGHPGPGQLRLLPGQWRAACRGSAGADSRRSQRDRGLSWGVAMVSPSVTPAEADIAAAVPRAPPTLAQLEALAGSAPMVEVDHLVAGYGYMEILHGFSLRAGRGRSLCLIGPNGAGKSTVLHAIY